MNTEQTQIDDGGPAFPRPDFYSDTHYTSPAQDGMSLRDYFAGKVISGFCANPAVFASNSNNGWALVNCKESDLVSYAYGLADAMIAARKGAA